MSLRAVAGARSMGLCLLVAAAAACGAPPPPPSPTPPVVPNATVSPEGSVPADPAAAPGSQPPEAVIVGLAGGAVAGDLGSYAWEEFASDSPWLAGAPTGPVATGTPMRVTFQPGDAPSGWQEAWARLDGGVTGEPERVTAMRGGPVWLVAPALPGSWSVQVFARFGAGRDAAWYWQVEVVP